MIPAMSTPTNTEKIDLIGLIPSKNEAIEPVQAPVRGRGIAMKIINPNVPYLSIRLLLERVYLKTQSKKRLARIDLLLRSSEIFPNRRIISIGGIILPIYEIKNATPIGIL